MINVTGEGTEQSAADTGISMEQGTADTAVSTVQSAAAVSNGTENSVSDPPDSLEPGSFETEESFEQDDGHAVKRRRKGKRRKALRTLKLAALAMGFLLLAAGTVYGLIRLLTPEAAGEAETVTEPIPAIEYAYLASQEQLAEQTADIAAEVLDSGLEEYLAHQQWLASHAVPEANGIELVSCRVENGTVVATARAGRIYLTDDDRYYLYAQEMYESGSTGRQVASLEVSALEEAIQAAGDSGETAGSSFEFRFPLNLNTADSNLYRRFFVGVSYQGERVVMSAKKFIENPASCAVRAAARNDHGKKGILPAAALIRSNGVAALGAQQAIYNMTLGSICAGSGINYTYNGKTYSFSASLISQYDIVVRRLNDQGAQVTMVLLNDAAGVSSLIHPDSRGGSGHYYAFNAKEQAGIERLAAAVSFVTERYSGTGHGTVDNWIVGNEINARADWNYMADVGLTNYAQAYADAFRVIYYAIKSQNANARVYISLDQQWAASANAGRYYSGKSFLTAFAEAMRRDGDLDWHVAVHPYNVPLTNPYAWQTSSYAPHSQDARYLSMRNIDVLTDFLSQSSMLAPDGQVRSVLCSEVGYTSSQGEGAQAASVVFGYQQAMSNSHIDGFILSRELDDGGEIAQGLAYGLLNTAAAPKLAYAYYQAMGTAAEQQYVNSALSIMGVSSLSDVITYR